MPSEELGACVAEERGQRQIDLEDRAVIGERDEAARRVVENRIEKAQAARYSRIASMVSCG